MTWLRLDDAYPDHPKVLPLSDAAFRLDVTAKCWAAARATDGLITRSDLKVLAAKLEAPRGVARVVDNLVASGLWEVSGDGWKLHDWLDYNPSAKEVAADRAAAAERMRKLREKKKCSPEQSPNERGTNGARSGEVRSSRPVPSSCSKEQDPPKSPKGPDTGEFKAKPQAQPEQSAVQAWEAIQKGAGGPQALGLARNYGQLNGTWLDDNKADLWVRNWSALQALERPPTLELCEKLGRWLVAGQKPIPAPWQCLAKGGNHANVGAWFDQAEQWDGTSDPRARPTSARAPAQLPQSPQPQRVYTETTAKRQADAIERGELPEVDPAIVAAELRKMQEATS